MAHLYVNPQSGLDDAVGTLSHPMKTLVRALEQAPPGTIIHLAPGTYSVATGERFPLRIRQGIRVMGEVTSPGTGKAVQKDKIHIEGSGAHQGTIGVVQVTIVIQGGAELRGVSLSNPTSNGTGVWLDNEMGTVRDCTIENCGREGALLTGAANARIENNRFVGNVASGLTLLHQSRADIRGNQFEGMRLGLAIGGDSAPLVLENQIRGNQVGIAVTSQARPVFRQNYIEKNGTDGLVVQGKAEPDLGHPDDPGGNVLRDNQRYDLSNATAHPVQSVGNWLNPVKLQGTIALNPQTKTAIPLGQIFVTAETVTSETVTPALLKPGDSRPKTSPSPKPIESKPIESKPTPNLLPDPLPFSDVDKHWAVEFIVGLHKLGILKGFPDGTLKPDHSLTRAEYAALLAQAFNLPFTQSAPIYSDVSSSFWAAPAIEKASRMGFLLGFPDGSFRPQQLLTRLQVLVSLVSGLKLPKGSLENLTIYDDRAQIPSYALPAVSGATHQGLVVNYPQLSRLNPLKFTTRGETAVMLYQALVVGGRTSVLASPYIVQRSLIQTSIQASQATSGAALSFALPTSPVLDVQDHPAEPFLRVLMERGFLRGLQDGSFQPDRPLTRASYAVFLADAFKPEPRSLSEPTFTDVPDSFWAKKAIVQAIRGGFLAGGEQMTFRPQQPVLRYQVLISLVSGLGIRVRSLQSLAELSDRDQIPTAAQKSIAAAIDAGLWVRESPPFTLRPKTIATRGEVAMMIYQGLVFQGRLLPLSGLIF